MRTLETRLRWIRACWHPHSQPNVSKIIFFFFSSFFFNHSKQSEFRTQKERLSQSNDLMQAVWCAQLLLFVNAKRPQTALKSSDAEGMVTVNTKKHACHTATTKQALVKNSARAALDPKRVQFKSQHAGSMPNEKKNSNCKLFIKRWKQKMSTDPVTFGFQSPEIYLRTRQDVRNLMCRKSRGSNAQYTVN